MPGEGQICDVCGGVAHLVYTGPVYSPIADEPTICAGCIENGQAAAELDAVFTDLGGDGWDVVAGEIKNQVLTRTPGFSGWQQEQWRAHCADAMAFLGPAGLEELESLGHDAVSAMRQELVSWGWGTEHIDEFLEALDRDGMPTAYVFSLSPLRHLPCLRRLHVGGVYRADERGVAPDRKRRIQTAAPSAR